MFDHYLKAGVALVMGHAAQGEQLGWSDGDTLASLTLTDELLDQFLMIYL